MIILDEYAGRLDNIRVRFMLDPSRARTILYKGQPTRLMFPDLVFITHVSLLTPSVGERAPWAHGAAALVDGVVSDLPLPHVNRFTLCMNPVPGMSWQETFWCSNFRYAGNEVTVRDWQSATARGRGEAWVRANIHNHKPPPYSVPTYDPQPYDDYVKGYFRYNI